MNLAGIVRKSITSPLGLTLVGASTGTVLTYLFGRTNREQELQKLKSKLDHAEDKIDSLNTNNDSLQKSIDDYRDRNQALLGCITRSR